MSGVRGEEGERRAIARMKRGAMIAGFAIGLAWVASAGASEATPDDTVIAPGELTLAGRSMRCGRTPTLVSNTFWDYGGATRGLIILNPRKLSTLTRAVRLYVYAHECGHQIHGTSEPTADCYAVKRGRREGWLTRRGVDEICAFLAHTPGDYVHPPGPARCRAMIACYGETKPKRAGR